MNLLFAQANLDQVPADTFKWVAIMIIGLIVLGCVVWATFANRKQTTTIEPQPVEVAKSPKRFNHDLAEQRYADHERRLRDLEQWRDGLIDKLEADKNEILRAGEDRKDELQKQINELPSRIVTDILNTRKLFGDAK